MTKTTVSIDLTDANVAKILTNIENNVRAHGFYSAYVGNLPGFTRDDVAGHARALADAWLDKYGTAADRKIGKVQVVDGKRGKYGNAVQAAGNGLRSVLDKGQAKESTELLTGLGKKATRDEVLAAWEAAQS